MARPRYSAAKRAREIRKQEERARKLARKHGRAVGPEASPAMPQPEGMAPDAAGAPDRDKEPEAEPQAGPEA
jgi:hypothetical protein